MTGLLMSLLFLTNVLDTFQALDDNGRPLPGAVLTFWSAGTVTPEPVYADQDLVDVLSDEQGRVVADSQGFFDLIYLRETSLYRVRLQTAQGVLRWDVDPYLCDCTDPPRLFRGPLHQALARVSDDPPTFGWPPQPGARLRFTLTGTDEPRDVYADAARQVPLSNPLRANAGGFFPPVYLDDETVYRIRLETASGAELFDVDPYECQCGFLLFTSWQYPAEFADSVTGAGGEIASGVYDPVFGSAAIGIGAVLVSGTMIEPIIEYEDWPADEAIGVGGAVLSGTMIAPIIEYDDWPVDAAEGVGGAVVSGTMIAPIIEYEEWPADAAEGVGGRINSGSMTLS